MIQDEIIEADAERSIEEPKNKEMFYKVARDYKAATETFLNITAGDIIKVWIIYFTVYFIYGFR